MEDKTDGKADPGWNDPPLFSFDKAAAIQATVPKKRVTLNKRVAYPMSSKAQAQSTAASASASAPAPLLPEMKPPPMTLDKIPQENIETDPEPSELEKLSKTEKLERVLKNLEELKPVTDDEISKRLKIMEKMWMEDKLDTQVQIKLISLTDALCQDDVDQADHLQMALMVDFVSQCSSWMSGIRQLINHKRNAKLFEC